MPDTTPDNSIKTHDSMPDNPIQMPDITPDSPPHTPPDSTQIEENFSKFAIGLEFRLMSHVVIFWREFQYKTAICSVIFNLV